MSRALKIINKILSARGRTSPRLLAHPPDAPSSRDRADPRSHGSALRRATLRRVLPPDVEPVLLAHEPDLVLVVGDVNRILTDAIADYLFVTEEDAIEHLLK